LELAGDRAARGASVGNGYDGAIAAPAIGGQMSPFGDEAEPDDRTAAA
jgi:hypothetical protein